MKAEQLKEEFLRMCDGLRSGPDVLFAEAKENKRDCVFTLFFHAIRVEVVCCWKWEVLASPPS